MSCELTKRARKPARFPIGLLGIAQICSWGTLYYSFPQLAEAVMAQYAWSKSDVYGALTLGLLLSAFAGLPFGSLIDKGHGRIVMTLGSIAAGIAFLVGAHLTELWQFYLLFAFVGFLHSATLYDAAFTVIANRFNVDQSKQYIVTLTLWGGFASTVFIPLFEVILNYGDWRLVMQSIGVINIVVCAFVYSRLPKSNSSLVAKHLESKTKKTSNHNVLWAVKQPMFWLLLISFALFMAITSAFKFHFYPLLLEKGLSATEVVAILAIFGPAQVAGRILLKLFGTHISMQQLGVVLASVLPVVFIALAFLPMAFWLMVPIAILFGAITGTMTIVKGVAVPEVLTKDAYGVINGAMNVPIKAIKAFAPGLAAVFWMLGTGYQGVLYILIILSVISAFFFYKVMTQSRSNEKKAIKPEQVYGNMNT